MGETVAVIVQRASFQAVAGNLGQCKNESRESGLAFRAGRPRRAISSQGIPHRPQDREVASPVPSRNDYRHSREMIWIPRNEALKTLSEGLDEHVSNRGPLQYGHFVSSEHEPPTNRALLAYRGVSTSPAIRSPPRRGIAPEEPHRRQMLGQARHRLPVRWPDRLRSAWRSTLRKSG